MNKRRIIKTMLIVLVILFIVNVKATSGQIRQNSVIKCNDKYYGNHGSPLHWHIVEKTDDKWVIVSDEVEIPSCYIEPVNEKEKVKFSKCVDGDTAYFIINNEEKKVRFLAINTPEVTKNEYLGKEASEYTCNALKKAKDIVLEYDANSDKEDKYGRTLAFVFVDNELLEKKLVEIGYAKVDYIYGDYQYVDELRKVEERAKELKKGIWGGEIVLGDEIEEKEKSEIEIIIKIIKIIWNYLKEIFDL